MKGRDEHAVLFDNLGRHIGRGIDQHGDTLIFRVAFACRGGHGGGNRLGGVRCRSHSSCGRFRRLAENRSCVGGNGVAEATELFQYPA